MSTMKNARKKYDKALRQKKGTKNIWMRFANGVKVDESTGTADWDEAQLVVTRKREEIRQEKILGIRPLISFDDAWGLYVERKQKFWGTKTYQNEKNMFDRMMGRAIKRRKGKHQSKLPPVFWSGIAVKCPNALTYNVLDIHYTDRVNQGASLALAKAEVEFIRRLVKFLHTAEKRVPSLSSIKIEMLFPDNSRKRIPLASEINLICSRMPEHHADYVKCLALTGSRRQEMSCAKYSDIEWLGPEMVRIWLRDTKNEKHYSKPLTGQFGELIRKRYDARNIHYDWIFPAPKDPSRNRNHSLEFWYRAIEGTDINSKETIALLRNHGEKLCLHHLRHFVGATLASENYSTAIIKKQLNQADDRSAQIYIDRIDNPHEYETMSVIDRAMNFSVPEPDSRA